MPHADVNGQRLFYEDSGGDGPVVLFSHGYLMDHTMFDPQVDALAPEFRCVRWDQRGFGATEENGKPFTYWDSADDAVGLLDRRGIDDAVFAGMSQGGFLSMRAALAHPERVRALVLIDTSADVDDAETLGAYQGMEDAWASPDTPDADHQALREAIGGLIIGDPEMAAPWVEAWGKERRDRTLEPFATLVSRDDITSRLGEITCPALVVHGTADTAIAPSRAQAMADGLVDCRGFVTVDGAAHAANLTHPDVVNPALLEFLRSL
jgi:pimeloyl-ACP methyl ester carboxylesterase